MAKQKQKVTIPGMVGWTLLQTAKHHGLLENAPYADSPYDYSTFGEGPCSAEDHVVVSKEYFEKLPPAGYQEMNIIKGEISDKSPLCARACPALPRRALDCLPPPPRERPAPARANLGSTSVHVFLITCTSLVCPQLATR